MTCFMLLKITEIQFNVKIIWKYRIKNSKLSSKKKELNELKIKIIIVIKIKKKAWSQKLTWKKEKINNLKKVKISLVNKIIKIKKKTKINIEIKKN
jgi:hypothetical protein